MTLEFGNEFFDLILEFGYEFVILDTQVSKWDKISPCTMSEFLIFHIRFLIWRYKFLWLIHDSENELRKYNLNAWFWGRRFSLIDFGDLTVLNGIEKANAWHSDVWWIKSWFYSHDITCLRGNVGEFTANVMAFQVIMWIDIVFGFMFICCNLILYMEIKAMDSMCQDQRVFQVGLHQGLLRKPYLFAVVVIEIMIP